MNRVYDRLATAVMVLCSICITALEVRRELIPITVTTEASTSAKPRYVAAWRSFDSLGISVGLAAAPVRIIEFVDYQCPACRAYKGKLAEIERKRPAEVSELFIEWPLPMHPFAQQAAQAVECANAQGRFVELRDLLFAQQDSFGTKSWGVFAKGAGVRDSARFAQCLLDPALRLRIQKGAQLAERTGLIGTPALLINGWLFESPPTMAEFDEAIDRARDGEPLADATLKR